MKKERREQLNILFKPLFFAVSALVALISVTVAWFAANTKVGSDGMQVSIAGAKFELASEGNPGLYYFSGDTGEQVEIDGKTLYKTSATNPAITWMVNESSNLRNADGTVGVLQPGAKGQISFYILPAEGNNETFTVEISINKLVYARSAENTGLTILQKAGEGTTTVHLEELSKEKEQKALQLLEGHLLFFTTYNEPYYSGWISNDTLEVTVNGTDDPIPVTIYWVWPYELDWLVAADAETTTLCDSSISDGDYAAILQDIKSNPSCYLRELPTETTDDNAFEPDKIAENYELYSRKYNRGDEFIGTNVQYLLVEIQAK